MEHAVDDILRQSIDGHRDAAGRAPNFASFATGRITKTDHDGYRSSLAAPFHRSVNFDSMESSLFGSVVYRFSGATPGSRLSIGAYAGTTSLDVKLGGLAGVYPGPRSGTAGNTSFLGGVTAVYSNQTFYAAGAVTGFSGDGNIRQTAGNFSPYNPDFDTSGYMVNGALGNTFTLGGSVFMYLEGGLRHIDMTTDRFAKQPTATPGTYQLAYGSTVASGTIGLYTSVPLGQSTLRPFARFSVLHDLAFKNTETTRDGGGAWVETVKFHRDQTIGQIEGGLSAVSGNWNFNASAYVERAGDHAAIGAKFGVRYDF